MRSWLVTLAISLGLLLIYLIGAVVLLELRHRQNGGYFFAADGSDPYVQTACWPVGQLLTELRGGYYGERNALHERHHLDAMRAFEAKDYAATEASLTATADDDLAASNLRARALYWQGRCALEEKDAERAYLLFTRLTWDFPSNQYSRRGRFDAHAILPAQDSAATSD